MNGERLADLAAVAAAYVVDEGAMRGKPIELVTDDDLRSLISDCVPEGRRLEFKSDVSVSVESIRKQLMASPKLRPVDRSWTKGRLANFGRDALAEEVVAFANADGGTLVLGMAETTDAPPRAQEINPLPDVAGLERKLRDAFIDCIEPRLPYCAVRALPTQADGSGVILIETSSSTSGPHWVSTSRRATIRREDRCDGLSMMEIHDMVLRRSRDVEGRAQKQRAERARFVDAFADFALRQKDPNFIGETEAAVELWLNKSSQAALGAQIAITPHFDIGIPRLEDAAGLAPSTTALVLQLPQQERATYWIDVYGYVETSSRKILGGVEAEQSGGFNKSVRIMRDGRVTVSFMQIRGQYACTCSADLIVGALGFAIGAFNRLRKRSDHPATPADLAIDIATRGVVGVGDYEGVGPQAVYGRLPKHLQFPVYGVGDESEFSVLIRDVAGDLMNAGGKPAGNLPPVVWNDS